jgi:hypothetical protein
MAILSLRAHSLYGMFSMFERADSLPKGINNEQKITTFTQYGNLQRVRTIHSFYRDEG